jgi:NAD(P)H-flavin reductase
MVIETQINPAASAANIPTPWVVRDAWDELAGTRSLDIAPADGSVPEFTPGQFNMLYVPGVGDIPISISATAEDGKGLVHTVRTVGAVSTAICGMKTGDWLGVRGPLGRGWPVDSTAGADVVVVAGGLGLAPVRPAIQHVIADKDRRGKNVVFYGARTPSDILFKDDLFQWAVSGDADVRTTVDRDEPGWNGNVGVVTSILGRAEFDATSAIAFVCGPEVMMRFVVFDLLKRGLDGDRIFISLERNMHCGIGLCGHCQLGPKFICTDGPVFAYSEIADLLTVRQL